MKKIKAIKKLIKENGLSIIIGLFLLGWTATFFITQNNQYALQGSVMNIEKNVVQTKPVNKKPVPCEITCPYWCTKWICNPAPSLTGIDIETNTTGEITSGIILRDVAIINGSFIASNNVTALFSITIKNLGNVEMPVDWFWHTIYLDTNEWPLPISNYGLQVIANASVVLQPQETYTFAANVYLTGNNEFTRNSVIHADVSTYPETDDNTGNNTSLLYLTGNLTE